MKMLLGAIIGFVLFNLFVGYIMWDITWFTHLGELPETNRVLTAIALITVMFIGSVIGKFKELRS